MLRPEITTRTDDTGSGKPYDPDDPGPYPGPFRDPNWRPDQRIGRHRRGRLPDPLEEGSEWRRLRGGLRYSLRLAADLALWPLHAVAAMFHMVIHRPKPRHAKRRGTAMDQWAVSTLEWLHTVKTLADPVTVPPDGSVRQATSPVPSRVSLPPVIGVYTGPTPPMAGLTRPSPRPHPAAASYRLPAITLPMPT